MPVPPLSVAGAGASAVLVEFLASWAAGQALDAVFDAGFAFFDQSDGMPIPDQTSQQLADGLQITINMGDIQQTQGSVNGVLAELNTRNDGTSALRNSLKTQDYQASDTLNGNLAGATDNQLDVVRRALNARGGVPGGLTPQAAKNLRAAKRASTDGKRVSMERHEYVYCRDSGQIDDVFTAANIARTVNHTYGRFVDAPQMRTAIERIRKVRRLSRGKGVTFVLNTMGINVQDIIDNLIDGDPQFVGLVTAGANQYNG